MTSDFRHHLADLLAPWAAVEAKAMFGGHGLYRGPVMFGLVIADGLYFKVDEADVSAYRDAGSAPFAYEAKGRQVTTSYWRVPAEVIEDADRLAAWAERAHAAALRARENRPARMRRR